MNSDWAKSSGPDRPGGFREASVNAAWTYSAGKYSKLCILTEIWLNWPFKQHANIYERKTKKNNL